MADPEAVRSEGWTPLHVACANGHLEVLRQLLEVQFFGGYFRCPNVTEMTIQKRDMVFGARIPPSSTWGYQTILDFIPKLGENDQKSQEHIFQIGWSHCCYAQFVLRVQRLEPNKSKVVFPTQFSGKFLNHLYLMGMTEESGTSCWISVMPPKMVLHGASRIFWWSSSSTQLVRWGAPPSCRCDTTPVNPANHTSLMRGSARVNPSTYPTGFRASMVVGFSVPSLELL